METPLNSQSYLPVDYGKFNYPTSSVYTQPNSFYPPNYPQFVDSSSSQALASYYYQPAVPPPPPQAQYQFDLQRQMRIEKHNRQLQSAKPMRFVSGHYDLDAPKRKYKYRKGSQNEISPSVYIPSDPQANTSQFSREDIIILKNILPNAEIHKWKYISNRLSKTKSKKLNTEYCITKFHQMYGLPFNQKNSPLDCNYGLKLKSEDSQNDQEQGNNFEGILGSSLGYILSRDGWNLID